MEISKIKAHWDTDSFSLIKNFGEEVELEHHTVMFLLYHDKKYEKYKNQIVFLEAYRPHHTPIFVFWTKNDPSKKYALHLRFYSGKWNINYNYFRFVRQKDVAKNIIADIKGSKLRFAREKQEKEKQKIQLELQARQPDISAETAKKQAALIYKTNIQNEKATNNTIEILDFVPALVDLRDTVDTAIKLYSSGKVKIKHKERRKRAVKKLVSELKKDLK